MKDPLEFTPEDRLAAKLIRKMEAGDVDSLKALYGLYQRPLLAFISSIVYESGAAEEILQDAFLRTFERADRYDPELGTPFVWVATIAKRISLDWLRKHRRRPQFVANIREQPANYGDQEGNIEIPGIHEKLEAHWAMELLDNLPASQRQAVELAFLRGFRQREIAEALHKPLGSVKSDLRRGLMRLRKIYLGEDD